MTDNNVMNDSISDCGVPRREEAGMEMNTKELRKIP